MVGNCEKRKAGPNMIKLKVRPNIRNRYSIIMLRDGKEEILGDFDYEEAIKKAVRLQYLLYILPEDVDICRRRSPRQMIAGGK